MHQLVGKKGDADVVCGTTCMSGTRAVHVAAWVSTVLTGGVAGQFAQVQAGIEDGEAEPVAQSNSSKKKERNKEYWKNRKQYYGRRGGRGGQQRRSEQ